MNQPIVSGRLSKRFLFSLAPGLFLASNVCHAPGIPVYVDVTAPLDSRERQWLEIRVARADARKCDVFRSKVDYEAFRKATGNLTYEERWELLADLLRRYTEDKSF